MRCPAPNNESAAAFLRRIELKCLQQLGYILHNKHVQAAQSAVRDFFKKPSEVHLAESFDPAADAVIAPGDCLESLRACPDGFAKLAITSPPYNIGKAYEKAAELDTYLAVLNPIIEELMRVLSPHGSVCWQVGNYVE